jgi:subtilisin family serine protease
MVAVLIIPGTAVAQNPEPSDTSGGEEPTPEGEPSVVELESGEKAVPDQVIVKFKEEASGTAKEDTRSDEGLEKKEDLDLIDAEVDKLEGQSVEEVISNLEAHPEVEYAEPDHIVKLEGYSDERRFGELWGLHNTGQPINGATGTDDVDINAPEASAITQGDKDLVVAVIDDGVDFTHPDLAGRQWTNPGESGGGKETNGVDDDKNGFVDDVNGWDFHNRDKSGHDANDYHGTHVSGTIAASANGEGVVGVATNVKIMALKFIGPRGGATSNAIDAIEYAKKMGAKISNNSWGCGGTGCYNQALKDAIDASGVLFVASAGNSGVNNDSSSSVGYPASYDSPNILSVAAVDNGGRIPSFSNYGNTSVDISAPGVSVLSSIPDRPDMSSVALSSVGSSGKAVTAGFGADEIGDTAKQASFMKKAFDAVGRGSQQVVLVDDASDAPSPTFNFPNVRPELRDAIRAVTGTTPTVINVPYGSNGPSLSQLQSKTVVWSTGQA